LNSPNVNKDYPRDNWSLLLANHIRVENPKQIPTLGIAWGYFLYNFAYVKHALLLFCEKKG